MSDNVDMDPARALLRLAALTGTTLTGKVAVVVDGEKAVVDTATAALVQE